MNSGIFRLVYSAVRGMLIAVEEHAGAHGRGETARVRVGVQSATEEDTDSGPSLWFAARALAFAALCAFGMQPLTASAQATLPITPDRSGPTHPVVGVSSSGAPLVNIVTPNNRGVSLNSFTQYGVGTNGVVLVNSGQNVQSRIAGWVQGNPFIGNNPASLIINQVTSGNPTQLLGPTEIAGRAANLVLANPAGITCAGCGFLNAPRVSLTTGLPTFNADGSLAGFNVTQGQIGISGAGLYAPNSAIDLIARAMTVNGQVWANSVNAVAGANQVDYASATQDLNNLGGLIQGNTVGLSAGHDINLNSTTQTTAGATGTATRIDQVSTVNAGTLSALAGHDLNTRAASISATGDASLGALNDVNLNAVHQSSADAVQWSTQNQSQHTAMQDTGTQLSSGGNLTVVAGEDINATAAYANAGGALTLAAGRDVNLLAGQQGATALDEHQQTEHGFLSTKSTHTIASSGYTDALGTTLSGDTVQIQAGRDVTAQGATVADTGDVYVLAGRNLTILTAASSTEESHFSEVKKSGFGATGSGISYGNSDVKDTSHDISVTQNGSLVGSLDGSVNLAAGETLHVTGSTIIAAQNMTGIGANVIIDAATNSAHHDETHEVKQSGFTLGAAGSVVEAVQGAVDQARAADSSQDGRASALHAIAAAGNAGAAAGSLAGGGTPDVSVQLSWGTSQSKDTFTENQTSQQGSTVMAGGTAAFVATGNGTPGSGNVTIAGSNVSAYDVRLAAKNEVNLVNSTSTDSTRSTSESSSASVGVSYGTKGFGVSASMTNAHGDANSDAVTQTNTHVSGANSVTIISGGDTNIIGANVSANQVIANIGGNLNIASVQDTTASSAHQQSSGGGFSISQGGGVSGSFSSQHGDASGNYAQVNEQAGIQAGAGGFDINVKGNTDLKGAIIASDADASKNSLTTGTLTFSDIQNHSDYSASSSGFTAGTSGVLPMISQHDNGSTSATTASGIGAGTISITDAGNQKQDVASLNRDTTNTNGTVEKTPDVNNLLSNQADVVNAANAAGQAVARDIGTYADYKQNAAADGAKAASALGEQDLAAQYGEQASDWSASGEYRVGMHIAAGALVGGLGGGNALAAAGGAAGAGLSAAMADRMNGLTQAIVDADPTGSGTADRILGDVLANTLAGAAGGLVGGNAGAFAASNADMYNRQLHPDEKKAIADKAGGDQAELDRLTKAACLAVKCWAEYPVGSDAYNANYVSQLEASQLGPELDWVNRQKEAGLFAYTPMQKTWDAAQSDPLGVAKDAAKIVIGSLTTKTGAGLCTTGLGCAAGVPMAAFGLSDVAEGADGLYNRYNGISSPGVNPLRYGFNEALPAGWGNVAYDGLNLATAIGALYAPVPLKMGVADGLNRPGSMFDVSVPRINNNTLIPFVDQAAPYGTTQGILLFGVGSKGATVINDIRHTGDTK